MTAPTSDRPSEGWVFVPALSTVRPIRVEERTDGCAGYSVVYWDAETGERLFRAPNPVHRPTRAQAVLDWVKELRHQSLQRAETARIEDSGVDYLGGGRTRMRQPRPERVAEYRARARSLARLADDLLAELAVTASVAHVA